MRPETKEATPTEIAPSLTLAAPGIHRLRLPLPFPTQSVNAYIIEGRGEIQLLDTGDSPARHGAHWTAALAHLAIDPAAVQGIYVTHHHGDHVGGARFLQDLTGAPVRLLDRDLAEALRSGPAALEQRRDLAQFLVAHGMAPAQAESWRADLGPVRLPAELPALTPVVDGQMITLGGEGYTVIWTPGHADGQSCLYNPTRRLLFGADHLLQRIVPPLLQAPGRRPDLVGDYLESLERVARLAVDLVLPGHGAPFTDLAGHRLHMQAQIEQRLTRIRTHLRAPSPAFSLIAPLYPAATRVSQQRYVLAELVSYLEHLVTQGRAERQAGPAGQILYAPL